MPKWSWGPGDSSSVAVSDPELLGRLLQRTVGRQNKTQKAAAKALGITQPHYNRLSRGQAGEWIKRRLYDTIRALVPIKLHGQLERALVAPDVEDHLGWYRGWLQYSRGFLGSGYNQHLWLLSDSHWWTWASYQRWDDPIVALEKFMRSHPEYRSLLESFWTWCESRSGIDRERWQLALDRVYEPLLGSWRSEGIERAWEEMHETGELIIYMKTAVKREKILLKRAGDLQRAKEAAEKKRATKRKGQTLSLKREWR